MTHDPTHFGSVSPGGSLDQVGMSGVEMAVHLALDAKTLTLPATLDAFVSLDNPAAKGIHMSKLYGLLTQHLGESPVCAKTFEKLLHDLRASQSGLSDKAFLAVSLVVPIRRQALKSQTFGWRTYPVTFRGTLSAEKIHLELQTQILYASHCPTSAGLARNLVMEHFCDCFTEENVEKNRVSEWLKKESSIIATAHGQRSVADIRISYGDDFPILPDFIDSCEKALATPVQASVTREDEAEFSRLIGSNLLFCEDAARRLKTVFVADKRITDFWIKVAHLESLHPHAAVSIVASHPFDKVY